MPKCVSLNILGLKLVKKARNELNGACGLSLVAIYINNYFDDQSNS